MTTSLVCKRNNTSRIRIILFLILFCRSVIAQTVLSDDTSVGKNFTSIGESVNSLSKDGTLRFTQVEDEQLSVSLSNNSASSLVHVAENGFSFNEYDYLMRITKQTVWKYSAESKTQGESEPYVSSIINYFYKDENIEPDWVESEYPEDKKKKRIQYSTAGLAIKQVSYVLIRDATGAENYEVSETVTNKYDGKKRLVEQNIETVIDKDNDNFKRYAYSYTDGIDKPSCDYYEDGILKTSLVRQDNSVYVQTVYFANNTSVETKYSSGVKVEEVFLMNGKVLRIKSYEN